MLQQATMPPIRCIIHWPNPIKNGLEFRPLPEAQAYIVIAGQIITSHLSRIVLSTCRRADLQKTILKQTGWEPAMFDLVDWRSLDRALRRVARHLQVTTAKLQFNLLATAVHMHTHGNKKIDKN